MGNSSSTPKVQSEADKEWINTNKYYFMACVVLLETNTNLYFDYVTRVRKVIDGSADLYELSEDEFQKYCTVYNINMDEYNIKTMQDVITNAHKMHNNFLLKEYVHRTRGEFLTQVNLKSS